MFSFIITYEVKDESVINKDFIGCVLSNCFFSHFLSEMKKSHLSLWVLSSVITFEEVFIKSFIFVEIFLLKFISLDFRLILLRTTLLHRENKLRHFIVNISFIYAVAFFLITEVSFFHCKLIMEKTNK